MNSDKLNQHIEIHKKIIYKKLNEYQKNNVNNSTELHNEIKTLFQNLKMTIKKNLLNSTPNFIKEKAQKTIKNIQSEIDKGNVQTKKFTFTKMLVEESDEKEKIKTKIEVPNIMQDMVHNMDYALRIENSNGVDDMMTLPGISKSAILTNITNCNFDLLGNASAITLNKIYDSRINIGVIKHSIQINDINNCVINMAGQQIRVNNAHESTFRLYISGSCILENCRDIKIGPFEHFYEDVSRDFDSANFNIDSNNWMNIHDFDFPRTDIPSPNWSRLDSETNKS
ncbi:hypothetical protein A3Q56_03071 [Intoshia linei]|uniref:C-CAP/cofactor C-like domain-containing protein n=1 Tax=Intoshia linei TaxID=1819745 RepID=A0A177B4H3_9BILA|nr:hypothetical protein A3Q56_03071 [Intoshia linei]